MLFCEGIYHARKAIPIAAHIGYCQTCKEELFEKGLVDRINEVQKKRLESVEKKVMEKIRELNLYPMK